MEVLEANCICKQFGSLQVLKDVSFTVKEGMCLGIIGPNGAGKTTLFNVICGILPPSSGRVKIMGYDTTTMPTHQCIKLGLGRSFQRFSLFYNLTVLENILLAVVEDKSPGFGRFRKINPSYYERALNFLEQVGLLGKKDTRANELSYGEQRQLELTLAAVSNPKLLLLDEPMAGLSLGEISPIKQLLHSFRDQNRTIVLIEHDMETIFDLADAIAVLHYGEVIARGSKAEIRANPKVQEVYLGDGS